MKFFEGVQFSRSDISVWPEPDEIDAALSRGKIGYISGTKVTFWQYDYLSVR